MLVPCVLNSYLHSGVKKTQSTNHDMFKYSFLTSMLRMPFTYFIEYNFLETEVKQCTKLLTAAVLQFKQLLSLTISKVLIITFRVIKKVNIILLALNIYIKTTSLGSIIFKINVLLWTWRLRTVHVKEVKHSTLPVFAFLRETRTT